MTLEERQRLVNHPPVNPDAHMAYLKGRFELRRRNEVGAVAAMKEFDKAISIEPKLALA